MADTRNVTLTIKVVNEEADSHGEPDKPKVPGESGGSGSASSPSSGGKSGGSNALVGWAGKQLAMDVAQTVASVVDYQWDLSLTLNDDYMGQRGKQIATSIIGNVAGIGGTIFGGAMSGLAVGGPIGAAVGAAVGIIKAGVQTTVNAVKAHNSEDIALRANDQALSFTRQRAGWSLNAGSIGEDL